VYLVSGFYLFDFDFDFDFSYNERLTISLRSGQDMPDRAGDDTNNSGSHEDEHTVEESVMSAMNGTEAKKWDEWDRRDSQSILTGADNNTEGSDDTSRLTDGYTATTGFVTEDPAETTGVRQALAHQKLIKYTQSAMNAFSRETIDESGIRDYASGTSASGTFSQDESRIRDYSTGASTSGTSASASTSAFGSSSGEGSSLSTDGSSTDTGTNDEADVKLDKARMSISTGRALSTRSKKPPVHTSLPSALSLNQRRVLEKFCSSLKNQGIEVLKQNRDSKWQVRYLTVSKDVTEIKHVSLSSTESEASQCPSAILWVKKFKSRSTYSTSLIDKQGRGGVMLSQLEKVTAAGRSEPADQLPKKFQEKYKDSVIVMLEYCLTGSTRSMALRCKTTDEAHFLCTGLRVCMDVLKREKEASEVIKATSTDS
jgi:hypothetical protein